MPSLSRSILPSQVNFTCTTKFRPLKLLAGQGLNFAKQSYGRSRWSGLPDYRHHWRAVNLEHCITQWAWLVSQQTDAYHLAPKVF